MDKIDKTFTKYSKLVIVKSSSAIKNYNNKNNLNKFNNTINYNITNLTNLAAFYVKTMENSTITQDNFYFTQILDDNSTDPSTNDTSDKLFQGYSDNLLNFASTTCIIFILIGVPGNLITIIALARCKKVRNATAVFIINLSLSDLLFCCFNLPLAASTFWRRSWDHGELLCRLFPLMRYGLLAVSLFTILAITINRYVTIGHPRVYPRIYRHRYLGIMVAGTWVGAFCSLIPTWRGIWGRFGLDEAIGSCTILRDSNGVSPKELLFILAFVLPCFCIIVCYARIFYIVRKTAMRTHEPMLQTSVRIIGNGGGAANNKTQKSQDTSQHSDRQLIPKVSKICKEENSENSSSISNSSGYQMPQPLYNSGTALERNQSQKDLARSRPYLTKIRDDELKYIDTSVESDFPPPIAALKYREKRELTPGVESIEEGLEIEKDDLKKRSEIDSALEEITSSTENNQVFHITANSDNQLLSVQVEPSSSSGIDLPMDQESPPRKRLFKKSFKTSMTRMASRKNRKPSTMNTSGASVLYPGKLSQKDRRLLKMILVIFLSFVICYLPITITKIWKDVTKIHVVNIMGYLLIYLTTCINPIIYVVMSSEYRQAYWNLLLCRAAGIGQTRNGGQTNGLLQKRSRKLNKNSQRA